MTTPRLWFAGTPEFAAHSLAQLLADTRYHVTGVLTQPDRPAGRGRKLSPSAVKNVALAHNIPIAQPPTLQADAPPFAEQNAPDLVIVAAYGLLLPQWFLDYPRLGCLNIHASLLPRWRGAAPIQRAIAAGDQQSGISIMQMDKGLDTGAIWSSQACAINDDTTAAELHDTLMQLGATTLLDTLPTVLAQTSQPQPQNPEHATYAHKLSKAEATIDWSQSATTIARNIRAYNPYPVAHSNLEQQNWRIYRATVLNHTSDQPAGTIVAHHEHGIDVATATTLLRLIEVQLPGKQRTAAADLRHGHTLNHKRFST